MTFDEWVAAIRARIEAEGHDGSIEIYSIDTYMPHCVDDVDVECTVADGLTVTSF